MSLMADPVDFDERPQRFEGIEQRMFNTGPGAPKTMPSAFGDTAPGNIADDRLEFFQDDASSDGHIRTPLPSHGVNECSNLSSTGSVSDREPETPAKSSRSEKKPRKRRRMEECVKSEKKITEYIRTQTSPRRNNNVPTNGESFATDLLHAYGRVSPNGGIARTTPTGVQYSSDSNSNSNQSPPGNVSRIDEETQTEEYPNVTSEDVAKRDKAIDDYRKQLDDLQVKLKDERRRVESSRDMIKRLLIEKNAFERRALLEKTTSDNPRVGFYKLVRQGDTFREILVEGAAFEELSRRQQAINNERIELQNASALLKKRKPQGIGKESASKRSAANSLTVQLNAAADGSMASTSTSNDDAVFRRPEEPKEISYQEYIELEEIYKLRKEHLKKEEADLAIEKEKLEREKQLHLRELKRAGSERDSRYKDHEVLHKRYLLLSLLGKGGFSEVWRAYDLEDNRYVACKVHRVNPDWKEEKKANYVKHAMREKDIHRTLDHCRIVKLFDLFTIDPNCFVTVLEYCPGNDLDFYLKQNKQIPEKEARSIIMQVVSALVYLNEKKPPIIHYDLKPANILLESGTTCGAVKITDFGLSKIMEGSEDDSIELTSQFAGTYWYLPPETFVVGHGPPKISSKVDVWSVGVIFYQCIYGKRPFGHEQTQQKILEENTIIKATEVVFPPKPQVSPVAQDFIRRCLQYRKEDRADVFELAKHELFRPRGANRTPSFSSPSISRSLSTSHEDV